MKLSTLFLATSLGLAATPGARADVIFDSMAPIDGSSVPAQYTAFYGQSFLTGAQDCKFTRVTLRMGGGKNLGGKFFVKLYDATGPGSVPGAVLTPLQGSADPSIGGDYDYIASEALSANTVYWVVVGVAKGPDIYEWWANEAPSPAVGTAIGLAASLNRGATWEGPAQYMRLDMQVNADVNAVPEPGQWAMMAVTLLGAGSVGLRQWRNHKG